MASRFESHVNARHDQFRECEIVQNRSNRTSARRLVFSRLFYEWRHHLRYPRECIPKLLPIGRRRKPTNSRQNLFLGGRNNHTGGLSNRLREIFDFSTSGSSPDKNSMHFYLHERPKLFKYRQAVVTALHLFRRERLARISVPPTTIGSFQVHVCSLNRINK
jgi:hypothetical protein